MEAVVMHHDEKMQVAGKLVDRIVRTYGDKILLAGIYGSVARNEDTKFSDLELIFITSERVRTEGMSLDGYREFMLKDTQILLEFKTCEEALEEIAPKHPHIGPWWPIQIDHLLNPLVLYSKDGMEERLLKEFKSALKSLTEEDFRKGSGWALIWIHGRLGKLRNAVNEEKLPRVIQSALHLIDAVTWFVAIINKRHYRKTGLQAVEESKAFSKIPEDYFTLIETLCLSKDMEEMRKAAEHLWENCLQLARENRIDMETYYTVDEVLL